MKQIGLLTPINRSFIQNARLLPLKHFSRNAEREGRSVYEVVRIIETVPLFLEEHLERLKNSCRIREIDASFSLSEIEKGLNRLVADTDGKEGNIVVFRIQYTPHADWLAYYIPHSYPTPQMIADGIPAGILVAERKNPQSKQILSVREKADEQIRQYNLYEVLLVNRHHQITEGSRSNVFFIFGNTVVTAPDERVLPGITRKHVFTICRNLGIELEERLIPVSDIPKAEAAFISGTSPKILPICQIDDNRFCPSHPIISRLTDQYNEDIYQYIQSKMA